MFALDITNILSPTEYRKTNGHNGRDAPILSSPPPFAEATAAADPKPCRAIPAIEPTLSTLWLALARHPPPEVNLHTVTEAPERPREKSCFEPAISIKPNADISLLIDRITELSQHAAMLTRKLLATIYQNDMGSLSPLGDIDDMIRLQFMLSEEISRLYVILHRHGQSSRAVL
ncbi:hypothetical protein BDV32DRAFT_151251 [Aspergillus pseudonomiae]|nr:hypothetical protein BDV32DRAFT_151251 [Aspergillus pseudonomiae]